MQVGVRGLLALALACGAAACMVNEHGLGSMDAGRPVSGSAGTQGQAGTGPLPGDAGSNGMITGLAGATGTGMAGDGAPTGAAGDAAGTGPDPMTGAAGDTSGAAGTNNGGAGVTGGVAGDGGGAGSGMAGGGAGDGAAGTSGKAGTSGAAGQGAAGIGAAGTGAAGSSAAAGKGGNGGAGSPGMQGEIGCSDGTREGYLDRYKYPKIAACEGAWDDPGVGSLDSRMPQCNRRSGNDGDKTDGRGCSVADLCAAGWSVCETAKAVSAAAPSGCGDAIAPYGDTPVYFLTRQRGTGLTCDVTNNTQGSNNLYGCGTIGSAADKSCAPFTKMLRDSDCKVYSPPWFCMDGPLGTSQNEYNVVTKSGPSKGGVLCCKP
jgi:hypothetical protein